MDPSELFTRELADELRELDSHVKAQRRQSLPELLDAWRRYAIRLAQDEAIDLDDYMAMLFARNAIQDVIERATPTIARVIEALVTYSDSIFLFCSLADNGSVVGSIADDPGPGWWWTRVPRRFTP